MFKLDLEKAEEPKSNCQHLLDHRKSQRIPCKTSTSASLTAIKPWTVWIMTNCGKFSKRWKYHTTLPISWETKLYVGQEATVRTEHGANDWFKIGKGVQQSWILPACLFNFFAECCCSVAQLCPIFVTPWTTPHQASLSFPISWSLLKLMSIESVMPSKTISSSVASFSSCPQLSQHRAFSNESALHQDV